MIREQTRLGVSDNSGAKEVECIRVLGGTGRRYANIGDVIVVTIKKVSKGKNIKKGSIYRALVVRTVKGICRKNGSFIRFSDNSVVLLNDKNDFIGTRVFGPVTFELKSKFSKVVALANEVF